MGLDMYLHAVHYVQNWDHYPDEQKWEITVTRGGKPVDEIDTSKIKYIQEEVVYWRKANAIHRWFVDNCQGGVDDCREAYVSREQLEELLDTVKRVLDGNHQIGEDLLAPQEGFFFGSTEKDEWYWDDLRRTYTELKAELDKNRDVFYEYHSSW